MLLTFSCENWMSYRSRATLSMIAGPERQHRDRISRVPKFRMNILPVTAIFGGNASGKSNLVSALRCVQQFVTHGAQEDSGTCATPFAFDRITRSQPSSFFFELLIDEHVYRYECTLGRRAIESERLVRLNSRSEQLLFERSASGAIRSDDADMQSFLLQNLRVAHNESLLHASRRVGIGSVLPVSDWFASRLVVLSTDRAEAGLATTGKAWNARRRNLDRVIGGLDTGVTGTRTKLRRTNMDANTRAAGVRESQHRYSTPSTSSVDDRVSEFQTLHVASDGRAMGFDLAQESDGTRQLLGVLPHLAAAAEPGCRNTVVIDELDRSLHPVLSRRLIESYLETCTSTSRSQVLFTTHDLLLMDQHLLRRDEMWLTERNAAGETTIFSVGDFPEVRFDKDLRKSYLLGRLGGVPSIGPVRL